MIAGPGFAKDTFKGYMNSEAVKQNNRVLIENKSKVLAVATNTAYK